MASNLPENLVGDMMSNAPRFTLPNFGAQNRPAPRPAAPAPQEPVQDGVAASPASPASARKTKPATAPAVSRVVEDALRDRISGGELDLSVLDNPKRSMSATRYSRTALVHYEVYKNLMTGLVSARAAHPEILPSNLTASAYIRACILALEN